MDDKTSILREVAKYYYIENLTQAQIAHRLGLSRPKVSRLLSGAREQGIVKVFIPELEEDMTKLENQMLEMFDLKKVKIVATPPTDGNLAFQITCKEAAKYLVDLLEDGDRIGVGWGGTLYEISKNMQRLSLTNSSVVQLFGNLDTGGADDYAGDILAQFAQKFDSKSSHIIPCPVIVGNEIIRDILMHDEKIYQSITLASSCSKMIINIGLPSKDNCLYKGRYITDKDLERLKESNSVGCIGCRFYDENGKICDEELDNRTIGVSIDEIKRSDSVITCVVGAHKAKALLAAMRAKFLDVVIMDSNAAFEVMKLMES
jgi:deoxyribonucleoside regulator